MSLRELMKKKLYRILTRGMMLLHHSALILKSKKVEATAVILKLGDHSLDLAPNSFYLAV